MYLSHF